MQEVYGSTQPKQLLSGPTGNGKRSSWLHLQPPGEVQRAVCLHLLAHSRCLINGRLMISQVHSPFSPPSVTVGGRPRVGELAAFSMEQDVQTWLQDASLWNAVANTNELPHVTRHLLCEQLDDSGTGRALKRKFIATVMLQASLRRRPFLHKRLLIRKIIIASTFQVPDTVQKD